MSAEKKGGREKVEMTLTQFQGENMTLTQFHGGNMSLTQFQGGNMKSDEEAENLWMKDFWNRIDTVQNV